MIILITPAGGQTIDVTTKLVVESSVIVTQELERRSFERVVDDVRLVLSDMQGTLSASFASADPTTKWEVLISVPSVLSGGNRVIFRGFIDNESVTRNIAKATIEFDCFSKTKAFWDKAKSTRLYLPLEGQDLTYIDLYSLLSIQRVWTGITDGQTIFPNFDLTRYAARNIRGARVVSGSPGNEGRFPDLDPETTFEDLAKAIAVQYNAEWFVDPETTLLTLNNRGKALGSTVRSLDSVLMGDAEISCIFCDDQKVDWLYVFSELQQPIPIPLEIIRVGTTSDMPGNAWYHYVTTAVIDGEEGFASPPLSLFLPATQPQFTWRVRLRVPATPITGATEQRLYRFSASSTVSGYRLKRDKLSATTYTDILDITPPINFDTQPELSTFETGVNAWVHFDEKVGGWGSFVLDAKGKTKAPEGEVFEATPQLRFKYSENDIRTDPAIVFAFFGRERRFTDPAVQQEWEDMFRLRRRFECRVKGMDYRVGDRFTSGVIPNDLTPSNELVVKKASIDLIKEETDLILLTV
jgi:hypothetical protein